MHALIIEDESVIAMSIEDALRSCGFISFDVNVAAVLLTAFLAWRILPPFYVRRGWEKSDSRIADPPSSHRPLLGPALVLTKRTFRLVFQPFINEMLRVQVEFNERILDGLALLHERVERQARLDKKWRTEIERKLAELGQAGRKG